MSRVTLRLPEDLHQRLRNSSERAGVSLNQIIVAALSEVLAREHQGGNPLAEQVQQIRKALGNVAIELDTRYLPAHLVPSEDLPDSDTLRQSMPELVPSLSATIIADREDRV